ADSYMQDLRHRQAEVAARTEFVQSALAKPPGNADRDARAMLVLLQRRGVDVDGLRRTAGAGPDVGPTELLRLYAESLRLESDELKQLVRAAEERYDRDTSAMRELSIQEMEEEKIKSRLDQSQEFLKVLLKRIQEIDTIRQRKP